MKNESQTQRPSWVPIASIIMALLVMATSLMAPQVLSFAKYVSNESAGVVKLSINHAHSILTDGYKLRHALATGTTTANAPNHSAGIAANTNLTEVYFGTPTEYASQIKGITPVDVSATGDGSILLYKSGTKAYIVSKRTIATGKDFGSVFENFTNLTKVQFSNDFDTSRATSFAYLFIGAKSLASANVGMFNTANATTMQSMFYLTDGANTALTSLDVSKFNTAKVTDMGSMFRGCAGLTALDLKNFNTANVWDMGGMFEGCAGLKSLNVTSFNTTKVETMQLMFSGLTMTSLDLRSFRCNSLNQADQMFSGCTNLKTIYADYAFDLRELTPETKTSFDNMFLNCKNLKGGSGTVYDEDIINNERAVVDIKLAYEQDIFKSSVGYFTHYSGADEGSTFLKVGTDVNIALKKLSGTANPVYNSSTNNTTTNSNIKQIKIGRYSDYNVNVSGMSSVSLANDGSNKIMAYWDSTNKTIYILSDSVICFNTSSDYIFQNFNGVESFTFSSFSTSAVKTMQRFFEGCNALTAVNVINGAKFETHNVSDFGGFMRYCYALPNSVVNNFVSTLDTSAALDLGGFFADCRGLTGTLNLTSFDTSSNLTYASMFSGCTGITAINISSFTTGSKINTISTMFSGCTNLKTIQTNSGFDLSKFTYEGANGNSVFTGCTNLVGGNNTKFNANNTNKTYARPDGGTASPGYFTVLNAQALSLRSVSLMMMEPAVSDSDMVSDTDIAETPVSGSDVVSEGTTVVTSDSDITIASESSTTALPSATTVTTTTAATTASTSASATVTTSASSDSTTATTIPVSSGDMTSTVSSVTAVTETSGTSSSESESSESTTATTVLTESTSSEVSSDETSAKTTESTAVSSSETSVTTTSSVSEATTKASETTTAATTTKTTVTTIAATTTTTTASASVSTVKTAAKTAPKTTHHCSIPV